MLIPAVVITIMAVFVGFLFRILGQINNWLKYQTDLMENIETMLIDGTLVIELHGSIDGKEVNTGYGLVAERIKNR
jgi:hypothetical protein